MVRDLPGIAFRLLVVAVVTCGGYFGLVVGLHFPYDTGYIELPALEEDVDARNYYERIYTESLDNSGQSDHDYVFVNRNASESSGVVAALEHFVERYALQDARTLEVGAGSGQLQDIVADYTGLDIAASAAGYFHKPFVQGSALDLPFEDNAFDVAWTIWTLEHVPDPEKAMEEIHRVVKPGGMLFFFPAWNCTSWAASGYEVRPYASLSLTENAAKASLAIRANQLFRFSYLAPIRLLRYGYSLFFDRPTRLRYTALRPNYTSFWLPDSDAVASIDAIEAMVWFESRGGQCLNCPATTGGIVFMPYGPLHIRLAGESTTVFPVSKTETGTTSGSRVSNGGRRSKSRLSLGGALEGWGGRFLQVAER